MNADGGAELRHPVPAELEDLVREWIDRNRRDVELLRAIPLPYVEPLVPRPSSG